MSDNGTSAAKKDEEDEGLIELSLSCGAARKRAPASSLNSTCDDDDDEPPPPSKKRLTLTRNDDDDDDDDGKGEASKNNINSISPCDEYQGFTFASSSSPGFSEIDRISAATLTPEVFFERYVAKRRPCVVLLLDPDSSNNNKTKRLLTLQDLQRLDGADTLICQVERRPDATLPFGQNRTIPEYMQELSLTQILERLQNVNTKHLYYLSTQQETGKEHYDDNEEDTTLPAIFSPLTLKLVQAGLIQDHVPLAGNLILETCHLWMGGSSNSNNGSRSSSSGLHHDFHDNFYLLQAGRKRFTIYPPNAAIPVYGQRECIHKNGLISYRSSPTRADGVPLSQLKPGCRPSTTKMAVAAASNINDDDESEEDDDDDDDEEEVVLGKGFDYQSDTDDDNDNAAAGANNFDDGEADAVDDYDALFGEQQQPSDEDEDDDSKEESSKKKAAANTTATASTTMENGTNKKQTSNDDDSRRRPDSFSRVNLSLDQNELHKAFPVMKDTSLVPPPAIVEIRAGECLYLPASWFHCVESFAASDDDDNSGGVHMAVNYWYHPPDRLDHFADPYKHDFWKSKTQKKA